MKKALLGLFFLFSIAQLHAQDTEIGNWIIYFGNKKFNDRWNWHHEVQYRNFNAIGDLEQLLLRTGIGYNLSPGNNNLLLGYGYILSEPYIRGTDDKLTINEHRIYQQFITTQRFNRFYLQHRYRIEERFVEEDFRMRFRYFLSINIALNNKEKVDKTFYLSAYNELFINGEARVFDRNRIYSALGYLINKNFRVELGYMTQIQESRSRGQLQIVTFGSF